MIDERRLKQLITDLENGLPQMENMMEVMGGGMMGDMLGKVALENTRDIVKALKEYQDIRSTKKMLDY